MFNNLAGATFDVQSDGPIGDDFALGGTFQNDGLFRKSTATGTTTIDPQLVFNNDGTVHVQSGALRVNGDGTHSGDFIIDAGTGLRFGGDHTIDAASTITGGGEFEIVNGMTQFGGSSTIGTSVIVSGGNAIFDDDRTLDLSLTVSGGTISGGADLTVNGSLPFTAGVIGGSGEILAQGGLNVSGVSTKEITGGGTVRNGGTTTVNGSGELRISNGAVFNNLAGATFDVQSNMTLGDGIGSGGVFQNEGTFRRSAGTGILNVDNLIQFNNDGTVQVQSGTMNLFGGGSSTGSFSVSSGATLGFVNNTYTFGTGTSVTGDGNCRIGGSDIVVPSGSTVDIGGLQLASGTIGGSGELRSDSFQWDAGILGGDGTSRVLTTGSTSGGAFRQVTGGRQIVNQGNWTHDATGELRISDGAVFNNLAGATFDVQSNSVFGDAISTGGTFDNAGTFRKSAGAGTTTFDNLVTFSNTGTVEVQTGSVNFLGGFTQTSGTTSLTGGDILGVIDYEGGEVVGFGQFGTDVDLGGTLRPGGSGAAATLSTAGDYTQESSGVATFELGGTGAGQFDVLDVGDLFTAGGELELALTGGFTPNIGDTFEIITFVNTAGATFSTTTLPDLGPDRAFSVAYNVDSVVVTVESVP